MHAREASEPVRVELLVHPDLLLDEARLRDEACRIGGVAPGQLGALQIVRKSVDARRRRVRMQLLVDLYPQGSALPGPAARPELPSLRGEPEVVIVGAGPAGLFCALELARRGVRARLLERGQPVAARRHDVARLSQKGELDENSNYCFGEGGAGTFSDGKLYTRSSKRGPVRDVLETFVAHGAPEQILIDARPHIGTNRLPAVVSRLRAELEGAGQELRFGARVEGLLRRGSRIAGVRLHDGTTIEARAVVLATGHSAGDVYRMLHAHGVRLVPKPFAIGVRVEHPQGFIDGTQYGALAGHPALGAASYRLVERVGAVSVFSFCMCPGGHIVPAATEPGRQVVNGWSPSSRRGRFANSGLVVEVGGRELVAAGLDPSDPFAGAAFQSAIEQRAFEAGGGRFVAPAQRLDDFRHGRASGELPATSYPRGVVPARLEPVLGVLAEPLRAALARIDKKLPGFGGPGGVAVGVESRTSAPLRIERDPDTLEAPGAAGLYPVAEGAGYAGGIMSAALDGMRAAERIAPR